MTLIVGKRSNLSKALINNIDDVVLVSAHEDFEYLLEGQKHIKVIFNNFQASTNLYDTQDLDKYIENSISHTANILTMLDKHSVIIDKIIYTSSSSVYGNNKFCSEIDNVNPMSLQASLKVANEELIKRFCKSRNINYTIARIFNMYGNEDNFSVISKIKKAYLNKENLNVINNGEAVRDYIHISDVVKIYKKLLTTNSVELNVLNIASGEGKNIKHILEQLRENNIQLHTNNIQKEEIKASIADTTKLNEIIDTSNFIRVEDFLLKELKR